MDYIYLLDLTGTFAFAVYGSYIAFRKGFDIFGITVCAFLCALGGGTIRELMLNKIPFYFYDYNYLYAVALGMLFCTFTYNQFHRINKPMLILDAVGLTAFAFIGAVKADNAHLDFAGVVFFAGLTALGGGILKDIVANETPNSFKGEVYATPPILLGVIYYLLRDYMGGSIVAFSLIIFIFLLRVLAIQFRINIKNRKAIDLLINKGIHSIKPLFLRFKA